MTRFILTRLLQIVVVLAIMSFVVYVLIGLMPGDPIDLMISADPQMTAADAARLQGALRPRPAADRALSRLGARGADRQFRLFAALSTSRC